MSEDQANVDRSRRLFPAIAAFFLLATIVIFATMPRYTSYNLISALGGTRDTFAEKEMNEPSRWGRPARVYTFNKPFSQIMDATANELKDQKWVFIGDSKVSAHFQKGGEMVAVWQVKCQDGKTRPALVVFQDPGLFQQWWQGLGKK